MGPSTLVSGLTIRDRVLVSGLIVVMCYTMKDHRHILMDGSGTVRGRNARSMAKLGRQSMAGRLRQEDCSR